MKIANQSDIEDFVSEVEEELGGVFEEAILYGSYARGEQDIGSDIDLVILVSEPVDESEIFKIVDRYRFEKDLDFSPRFFLKDEFEIKVEENYSFYKNVADEGVEI